MSALHWQGRKCRPESGRLGPLPEAEGDAETYIETLERDARGLTQLALEARRLDPRENQEARLRAAADTVMTLPGWDLIDRVRLVEILAGPRAAREAMTRG